MGRNAHKCPTDYTFLKPPQPLWGPDHPRWKGDTALTQTKRDRARRRYRLGPCEQCGAPATDRHHKDGNTGNNEPRNIAILCRRCHQQVDGRAEAMLERFRRVNAERVPPTHCPHGHEYTPENTHFSSSGRQCRTCGREKARERRARKSQR
jgi:hypothetical protein